MSKQDAMKMKSCVLRVNIHCDGCKHEIEKKLRKIKGVYKVSTDVEKGKVTISGNVDPIILIEKLQKTGKHAELWGVQKPANYNMNNQFNNIQFEKGDSRVQKAGFHAPNQKKDIKFPGKDRKTVKFDFSEEDSGFEEIDEDGFDSPSKVAGHGGKFSRGIKPVLDKKGSRFNMFVKSILGKKGGNQKKGGKDTWFVPGEGKIVSTKGDRGKNIPKLKSMQAGMYDVNPNPRLGGGMNAANFQGMNPYNQQQYMQPMQMMMMMNQQHGNGQGGYHHPSAYMQQPIVNYGPLPPAPATDRYTHMFSDENTDSCSVM